MMLRWAVVRKEDCGRACAAADTGLESVLDRERRIGGRLGDLEERDDRQDIRRSEEESNRGPYVQIALGLAFAGLGVSAGVSSGELVPVFIFMFPALVLLALGISKLQQKRSLAPKLGKERELLSAIRASGGSITPAEAAMETSLTVKEADRMLSELARNGNLTLQVEDGIMAYALRRRDPHEMPGEVSSPLGEKPERAPQQLNDPLTERELEVLSLLASGRTNSEIARDLFVTVGTVKSHTSNIYRKLGARNRGEALARLRERKLLD